MHDLHGVQSRAGRPADHGVGISAADDLVGLAHGQVGTGLAHRQRIARPAKIVENRHVAGGHVGQILEQPQRRHLGQALEAPAGKLEFALAAETLPDALGKLLGQAQHVVGAEADADPIGIDLADLDGGVGQGQLGHGHAHLALAAQHPQGLANLLLLLLFQGAEVFDFARELLGLGGDAYGHRAGRQDRQRADAAAGLAEGLPQGFFAASQGADQADACDDNPSLRRTHVCSVSCGLMLPGGPA